MLGFHARADIRAGRVPAAAQDSPHVRQKYNNWVQACAAIGPIQSNAHTRRSELCAKRKRIRDRLPLHLRASTPAELLQAACAAVGPWAIPAGVADTFLGRAAEGLLDVEWQLEQLRVHTPIAELNAVKAKQPWQECTNPGRLRRKLRRREQKLSSLGGTYAADTESLQEEIAGMRERLKNLEWEDYDQRMIAWTLGASERQLARARPRRTISYAERVHRRGGKRGPPVGSKWEGSDKPRRPHWLKEQDDADYREQREISRSTMKTCPLPKEDRHQRAERRKEDTVVRVAARKQEHAGAKIEHQMLKLTEWVWGEGKAWGIVLLLDNGWAYCDTDRIPYATQRAAALERCAVQVTGGWCFPPRNPAH
jgi:hypothetical protein